MVFSVFQQTFSDINQAAEKFVYDGAVIKADLRRLETRIKSRSTGDVQGNLSPKFAASPRQVSPAQIGVVDLLEVIFPNGVLFFSKVCDSQADRQSTRFVFMAILQHTAEFGSKFQVLFFYSTKLASCQIVAG